MNHCTNQLSNNIFHVKFPKIYLLNLPEIYIRLPGVHHPKHNLDVSLIRHHWLMKFEKNIYIIKGYKNRKSNYCNCLLNISNLNNQFHLPNIKWRMLLYNPLLYFFYLDTVDNILMNMMQLNVIDLRI